ncbi:hypothetical protein BLL37_10985 [Pseudomonas azotoformans]|uniref:Dermonecrotic toxin N-terminal domain-containing protein n=1 Tax=Pseudomonas azotoformans TaxID=47878 RepID=A0A1V2JJR2_PSEAZ|nr:DUF6543 domain-containing protein [Pseudomonas azotoformans]OIN47830.1 hypothetical protein BFL39_16135 [Pseudomonas azotoformans]ONH45500.1 hypothetical protein BLL37_10985 [Pseudomonas azotoformans]SDO31808.1 hypothetical protein SAMN04489799_4329 [Pseudomonas azotoformans]
MTSTKKTSATQQPPRYYSTATLITQLSTGPAFREVAAVLLRRELKAHYPNLDIDPNITLVGTAVWDIVDDQVVARPPRYQALADVLAKQAVLGVPAIYIEGEHFLTQLPIVEPPVHLQVRIEEIANIINLLAPVMITGFQEQQAEYWNQSNGSSGPHWYELSSALRSFWNVDEVEGWTHEDCVMARSLYTAPDPAVRKRNDPYQSRACLVDIFLIGDDGKATHLNDSLIAVLVGKQQGREVLLTYSPGHGYDKFESTEELGNALENYLPEHALGKTIDWRLYEPSGNFFDQQACILISIQIDAIGAIRFTNTQSLPGPVTAPAGNGVIKKSPGLDWFREALPDWLSNASSSDQDAYGRHLKDLAALHSLNEGQAYNDGIAPIEQYALDALKAEMLKDHDDARHLPLDRFDIVVQSPVIWGSFTVPGQTVTTTFNLAQLALQNLIALPLGNKTLRRKNSGAIPDWLTVDYVETLITRIDIGRTYPALIQRTLLDDQVESWRREKLYTSQLRIQLPMLALQYKLNQQGGIDERGYRYVIAALQESAADRKVEGDTIVVRPLSFLTRHHKGTRDTVANMFVIGPVDLLAGPCLLYRPLLDEPLSQYPSPANLIYAIQQSPSLRESVLAWLPDSVRTDYSRYVFPGALPSPWSVVDFLVDPAKVLELSGPLLLGDETLNGDVLSALFKANANALVELANRESVSNADARWATFKHTGWLIFNAALPFLGSTVGVAAWIWQIMDQLQEVVEAEDDPQHRSRWSALTDLLLNLGMAITLHRVTRRPLESEPPTIAKLPKPVEPTPVERMPTTLRKIADVNTSEIPSDRSQPLHTSGASHRNPSQLGTFLDSYKIDKPDNLGKPISESGPRQHLYQLADKYYAPVGNRWFQVIVDEGDNVIIVDPKELSRLGPLLVGNRQGNWFIDTRLRLRGGGPSLKAKLAKARAEERAQRLRTQLSDFEKTKKDAQAELQKAHKTMNEGSASTAEARRQSYLQTLVTQRENYESALQQLKQLNVFAPSSDYAARANTYIKAQIELTNAGIREALTRFTPKMRTVLDQLHNPSGSPTERPIDDAHQMVDLAQDMIGRLDYMNTRFDELRLLSKEGVTLIRDTKGTLPAYTREHLKALQVTLTRHLCLPKNTLTTASEAWSTIDAIIDSADIVIQCLTDTLQERSESRLDERIDTLGSLIGQFQILDERLSDFAETFNRNAQPERIRGLREHLSEFSLRASQNLALLIVDRDALRLRPTPPPTVPRPVTRFIRTHYDGIRIGEPRLTEIGLETDLVDIRSPITQKVIATYHEKTPGVWVERLRVPAKSKTLVTTPVAISQGQALLDALPDFHSRADTLARQETRTPMGIEYLYHQHALRLEHASEAIDRALTHNNITDNESHSASTVNKALTDAIADMYRRSREHVLRLYKKLPPTIQNLEWLLAQNEVTIKKTLTRRKLRSPRPDFLDEYSITDRRSGQPLWYAHFHYSTAWTPAKYYIAARLKTVAEHLQGVAADTTVGLNEAERIDFYLSEIGLEPARRLFFEKKKT